MRAADDKKDVVLMAPSIFESYGGIQTYMRLLIQGLSDLNYLRGVISFHDSGAALKEQKKKNGYCCDFVGADSSKLSLLTELFRRDWNQEFLLLGHVSLAPIGWLLLKFQFASSFGVILHGIEAWEQQSMLRQFFLNEAEFFVSSTPYTRQRFEDKNKCRADYHEILPLSLEPERFDDICFSDEPESKSASDLEILTVSRLDEEYKGIGDVIRALNRLKDNEYSFRYTVVGDGSDRTRLEKLARELGVFDCIKFEGNISDQELENRFRAADVFAMPSAKEGFGLVYLEAMYFGLPIIASPEKGAKFVLRDGYNGLAVSYGSSSEIADALIKFTKPDFRALLSKQAQRDYEKRFDFSSFSETLETILR